MLQDVSRPHVYDNGPPSAYNYLVLIFAIRYGNQRKVQRQDSYQAAVIITPKGRLENKVANH